MSNSEKDEKIKKYKNALLEILELGSVCDNFMLCKHSSCKDSSGAVLIALEALKTPVRIII